MVDVASEKNPLKGRGPGSPASGSENAEPRASGETLDEARHAKEMKKIIRGEKTQQRREVREII